MRAVVHDEYGALDVLKIEEIDKPELVDDGVPVRVRAAALLRRHPRRGRQALVPAHQALYTPRRPLGRHRWPRKCRLPRLDRAVRRPQARHRYVESWQKTGNVVLSLDGR
jgi:hypothetical protein